MDYQQFITTIAQCQTDKIKSVSIPESSSPWPIPEKFRELLPEVINVIEKNFDELSDKKSFLAVFGFQPTGIAIESDFPILKNRIFLPNHTRSHLSCVIYFLPVDDLNQPQDWANYKSVVVDFTSGVVMNSNYYLCTMGIRTSGGKVLGKINAHKLNQVWNHFKL